MFNKFCTKLLAAVVVAFAYYFLANVSWQIAAVVGFGALVVDLVVVSRFNLGTGWLLFLYGLWGLFAHYYGGIAWYWLLAFAGFSYYVTDVFLNESKIADLLAPVYAFVHKVYGWIF